MNPLLQALRSRALSDPDGLVLCSEEGGLTGAQLLSNIEAVQYFLADRGVQTVALYAHNCIEWAVFDIACQLAAVCLVPVPTFFTPEQRRHVLASSGCDSIVYSLALATQIGNGDLTRASAIPQLPGLLWMSLPAVTAPCRPQATTKITYTSGSTGTPKGVCLSFEQCLEVGSALALAIATAAPRHLCVMPLSTLLENIGGIYMPILAAGTAVIVSPETLGMSGSSGIDSATFLSALSDYQPQSLILVPQLLSLLDIALTQGWVAPPSLRFVAVGGARVAPSAVTRVRSQGVPVYEGYGLSECASVVSLNSPGRDRVGTSGAVLPHLGVKVRDGEIIVSGNTFLGYLDDPSSWGMPEVCTGDIGSIDADGFITINGRCNNVIVTAFGRNVSPEWVESELLASDLIQQAVVVGHSRPILAALIYPRSRSVSAVEIQRAIDTANLRLPDYARVGPWLMLQQPLSTDDGLLTSNGRPRRSRIEQEYADTIEYFYNHDAEVMKQ